MQKCPLSDEIAHFYCRKPPADYYISRKLGLIFQNTMPSVHEMAVYVDSEYQSGLYKDYVEASALKYETFRRRIELIRKYVDGSRLLDVGCASGFFIEMALKYGFDAYGVELSKQAIALAKPEVGGRITNGDVNLLHVRNEQKFDVVVAFDIIEHTHDPIKFLQDIRDVLSPQGWLVLTTPDTGHFLRYLMGSHWPMLQPLQHTYLFSKKAMQKALETAGFNKIHIQNADKTLTLEYLMGQIRINNPLLTKMYRVLSHLLPMAIRKRPISVNIGEMLVFCQRES